MATPKLLVVIGATGVQGSSIISHFLEPEQGYRIRGLTRDSTSNKATALAKQGVEIVKANLNNVASLRAAFEGANAIFAFTDSAGAVYAAETQEILKAHPEKDLAEAAAIAEFQQGKNIADAAASVGTNLERLVWSTLPDPVRHSKGKFPVVHELQAKARVLDYMHMLPELVDKVSSTTFSVFTNSIYRGPEVFGWTKQSDGEYVLRVPCPTDVLFPWIHMERDAGSYVAALLQAPAGTHAAVVGGLLSYDQVAALISTKLGVIVRAESVSLEEYAQGNAVMRDVGLLLRYVLEYGVEDSSKEMVTPQEVRAADICNWTVGRG